MARKFVKGDRIMVITGKDKGKISTITSVDISANRVFVEGVNIVTKSLKPTKDNPDGGFVKKEMSLHVSNLSHVDGDNQTRVGFKFDDGKKVRFYKKTGAILKSSR